MPNALNLLGGNRNKYKFKHRATTALIHLTQKGYVVFENKNGRRYARITPAGSKMLAFEEERATLQLQKKKRWDKKWRVVIFDVPEYRRGIRDAVAHDHAERRILPLCL